MTTLQASLSAISSVLFADPVIASSAEPQMTNVQIRFMDAASTISSKRRFVSETLMPFDHLYDITSKSVFPPQSVTLCFFGEDADPANANAIVISGMDGAGNTVIYSQGGNVDWFPALASTRPITSLLFNRVLLPENVSNEIRMLLEQLEVPVADKATDAAVVVIPEQPATPPTFEQRLRAAVGSADVPCDTRVTLEEAATAMFARLQEDAVVSGVSVNPPVVVPQPAPTSAQVAEELAANTPVGLPDTYTGGPTSVQMLDDTEIGADAVVPEVPAGVVIRGGRVEQPGARRNRR